MRDMQRRAGTRGVAVDLDLVVGAHMVGSDVLAEITLDVASHPTTLVN